MKQKTAIWTSGIDGVFTTFIENLIEAGNTIDCVVNMSSKIDNGQATAIINYIIYTPRY
jgi:hypothetical protein